MRKYTVYEIEKLTKGKLTKYKLNQAIEKKELIAEEVKSDKRGKGIPKFYIYEDELQNYLSKLDEEKKKKILLPGEDEASQPQISTEVQGAMQEIIDQNKKLLQVNNEHLDMLRQRINYLEEQNSKIMPFLEKESVVSKDEERKASERRELLMELVNMGVFSVWKKKDTLKRLNKLL